MSTIQLITGVTAGEQTQYGSASIENLAQAAFVVGIPTTSIPRPRVSPDGFLSVNLVFDLTDTQDAVLALQFRFGDGAQLLRPEPLDSLQFGTAELETAQQAIVLGWDSFFAPRPWVTPAGFISVNLQFDLLDEQYAEIALHFAFGEGPRVLRPAGLDSLRFGSLLLEAPATLFAAGLLSLEFGRPLLTFDGFAARRLEFDLSEVQEASLALHFRFDGPSVLRPASEEFFATGAIQVENAAQAFYPVGIPPTYLPRPWVTPFPYGLQGVETPGAGLVFDLVTPSSDVFIPVQFAFGANGTRQCIMHGLYSFESGLHEVEELEVRRVYPVGWQSTQFGSNVFSWFLVYPHGWDSLTFGPQTGIAREGELQVFGFNSFETGTAEVETDNLIRPFGLNATLWGIPHAEYIPLEDQFVEPASWLSPEFGTTWISNWWREIWPADTGSTGGRGTPFVAFRIRYLNVFQGINSLQTGQFQVGFHQDVDMIGRDHLVFGEPEIKIRHIYVFGFNSLTFGPPYDLRVSFGQQYLLPRGHRPRNIGEPRVWNRTQYVQFYPLCPEPTLPHWCGPEWGQTQHTHVRNRNRHVYPHGTVMTRFAFRVALVTNTGRAVWVKSVEKENFGPWYEQHQVAFYIRYFPFVGWDSFRMVAHHLVYNAARALYVEGLDATQFGTGLRSVLWRWLLQNGRRMDEHGTPWVSRSPRFVQIFNNRASTRFSHPFVDFGTRYIEPVGRPPRYIHGPILTQKPIPTLTPQWRRPENRFGQTKIHNNTPQLFVVGRSMFDSSPRLHWVSHSPRYPGPHGWQVTRYGRPNVLFRDRTIFMWSHESSRVPQQFRIENVDPDPIVPGLQFIYMEDFCKAVALSHQGRCSLTGLPTVSNNTIYMEGDDHLEVGAPTAIHNAIVFKRQHHPSEWGWATFGNLQVNRPGRIFFGPYILVEGDQERGEHYGIGPVPPPRPRVHPHTIWARLDAPAQAVLNHGNVRFCEIDKFCELGTHPFGLSADGTGPWFGNHRVWSPSGLHRTVDVRCTLPFTPANFNCHRMFMRLGAETVVQNRNRRIQFAGWRQVRFGFPRVVTPSTRTVRVWGSASTGAAFEEFFVGLKDRAVPAPSVQAGAEFGATQIENFNREVYVVGLNATQWGNNNPMVHFPRTLTPYDNVLTQWGTAWASHSPRWVFMEGRDHFETAWTWFESMMTVRNSDRYVRGYDFSIMTEWGMPLVTQDAPIVNPYGIAAPCVSPHVTVEHS